MLTDDELKICEALKLIADAMRQGFDPRNACVDVQSNLMGQNTGEILRVVVYRSDNKRRLLVLAMYETADGVKNLHIEDIGALDTRFASELTDLTSQALAFIAQQEKFKNEVVRARNAALSDVAELLRAVLPSE